MVDERLLPGPVTRVLAPDLGHGDVGLVQHDQEVLGEEVEQRVRRLPRGAAVEVAAVVLHAAAHPRLGEHLEVVLGPHAQALGLEQLAGGLELAQSDPQLVLDALDGPPHPLVAGPVVGVGEHDQLLQVVADLPGQDVERSDPLHRVPEELHPHGPGLVGRVDLHGVAVDPELTAGERRVVAGVLELDEALQERALLVLLAGVERDDPVPVLVGRAQAVDAGHGSHHDGVGPQEERRGRGVPEPVDLVVDRRVLLDVGVRARHVRLGLVVVVVGHEVLDPVPGEELLQLGGQLGRQRLVRLDDQRGPLDGLDGPRDGRRLARPRDPEEGLVAVPAPQPLDQSGDRLGLVTGGLEGRYDLERGHVDDGTGRV